MILSLVFIIPKNAGDKRGPVLKDSATRNNSHLHVSAIVQQKPVINCVCKDHRDKIKVPDPVVKDLISKKIVKQII